MLTCPPKIIADDIAGSAAKRRRLNGPDSVGFAIESGCTRSQYDPSTPTLTSTCVLSEEIRGNTLVCYGMVSDLKVNISPGDHVTSPPPTGYPIHFEPPRTLHSSGSYVSNGQLDQYGGDLLTRLMADDELILQLSLTTTPTTPVPSMGTKPLRNTLQFLGVVIYGPKRRSGDVGEFMTQAGCYLDDPVDCDRNVPYLNPQCLFSLHERLPMTFAISQPQQPHMDNFTRVSRDVLSGFETTDEFELSASPVALRTELKPHQRQALTFLLRRERGMHPSKDGYGLWLRNTGPGQSMYVNTMTDEFQATPGPLWYGGLLADEMGLGKTLSMIALIACDREHSTNHDSLVGQHTLDNAIRSTLIVLTPNLFSVWESQLRSHVHDGKLTWSTHHGRQRFEVDAKKAPPDIVFSTYQTIEREYRKGGRHRGSLLSYHWKRIVLDEAHIIRNHNTSTSQAMAALRGTTRWAISGTPIQNSLLDFHGLFKFLHFSPYDDPKIFDQDILNVWRVKPPDEAADTFKRLLSCIMIRRTKAILDLPCRDEKLLRVPFSHEEKEYYRRIEQPVVDMLDRTIRSDSHANVPWMTAIQQINKLRLVCNMGVASPSSLSLPSPRNNDDSTTVLSTRYMMGGEICVQCFQSVQESTLGQGLLNTTQTQVYYSACHNFYCADCAALLHYSSPDTCTCTHQQPCRLSPLAPNLSSPRLTPTTNLSPSLMGRDQADDISSKVWALLFQIRFRPQEKHVVFSSWTSSLDMVERALRHDPHHILNSLRIDGKVHPKNRGNIIQQLHKDPSIRVILITTGCGAYGLDLTAASVVHLLEPQWNPSIEDQALARVHRLGQSRPVTTIRYVMEDSFEEHILKIQDRKKLLATTLLSNGSTLESLRQLLHENKSD